MAPASLVPGWTSPLHAAHLHFKSEVFLQVLDDHHQERQFDAQGLLWVSRARDVRGTERHRKTP